MINGRNPGTFPGVGFKEGIKRNFPTLVLLNRNRWQKLTEDSFPSESFSNGLGNFRLSIQSLSEAESWTGTRPEYFIENILNF